MKVKVHGFADGKFGFYGEKRRYNGQVFELTDPGHFSEKWMEKLEEDKPKRGRKPKAEVVEEAGE